MRFPLLAVALLATSLPLQHLVRESNSDAELRRGVKAYREHKYDAAARAFARAGVLAPSARAAYDEATARLAQGDVKGAAPLLDQALRDPALRAASLYNRGTAALSAKQTEQAVADLSAALRLDPSNREAKRNLELAVRQQMQQQQQSQDGSKGDRKQQAAGGSGQGNDQKQSGTPQQAQQGSGKPEDPSEALLRSVQQQEEEELSRMRKAREERRSIGW